MSNIKVMVAAHKKFPMPDDRELYLPILVGAKDNFKPNIDFQKDDDGINISSKNPNYNELTAVYWAWKNLNNVDAIGLVHYRRLFKSKLSGKKNLTKNEIEERFKSADVILPNKRHYYIETNETHYLHAHESAPLKELKKIIDKKYPDYSGAFQSVMNSRSAHMFNMFIMKKDYFDSYAHFIFSVLTILENEVDISEFSIQEARVYGYLSELLMDVWIKKNDINYSEIRWYQIGKKHVIKKVFYFTCRKFGIKNGKTHF